MPGNTQTRISFLFASTKAPDPNNPASLRTADKGHANMLVHEASVTNPGALLNGVLGIGIASPDEKQ